MITNIIIFVAGMMVMAGMIWAMSKFAEPHDGCCEKSEEEKMLESLRETSGIVLTKAKK